MEEGGLFERTVVELVRRQIRQRWQAKARFLERDAWSQRVARQEGRHGA